MTRKRPLGGSQLFALTDSATMNVLTLVSSRTRAEPESQSHRVSTGSANKKSQIIFQSRCLILYSLSMWFVFPLSFISFIVF